MSDDEMPDGPEGDDLKFARNMVVLREQREMSQADLVRLLQKQGWSSVYQTTISRIEKGERPVRYGEARAISRALGVSPERMLMTLTDSVEAGRLSWARARLTDRQRDLRESAMGWHEARDALEEVVRRVLADGVEPTALPEDPDTTLIPATLEDELALSIQALETLDPGRAVEVGKIFYDIQQRGKFTHDPAT